MEHSMNSILFLIGFPLIPALLLLLIPNQFMRNWITRISAVIIGGASIYCAWQFMGHGNQSFAWQPQFIDQIFFGAEMILAIYLLIRCIRIKPGEWYIPLLILAQACIIAYCEFVCDVPEAENTLYIDNFSIIMGLIIGIIGSMICVYALSYMRDYHKHNRELKDGQRGFFFILFFFLSAMFGIVFTNNLIWIYLFWEITTLASFELIGYPKTEEATRNAYRALGFNSIGGLGFALGILYLVKFAPASIHTIELSELLKPEVAGLALIPAILISFAGLAKSAQMPFSNWLLGAMVAPTPVSALLHSSTMVKAGVFILVKFATVLHGTLAGGTLALIGGVTFLMTSIMAVTQSNSKRVLAYSTIANLGLVAACAGVGTPETIWAAILLIIFHAVAKGLLFLGVGSIEHKIGSRDIEDMGGLIAARPGLAVAMLVGILGMFLAPFGMLLSKWVTFKAFIDSSPILAILLAYGSAPTLFFWAKWMGKLVSIPSGEKRATDKVPADEWWVLSLLAIMTIAACGLFPLISTYAIAPYIEDTTGRVISLGYSTILMMILMLAIVILLPVAFLRAPRTSKRSSAYLAGANLNGTSFTGSAGLVQPVQMRNYYLTTFFNEKKIFAASILITIALFIFMFGAMIVCR